MDHGNLSYPIASLLLAAPLLAACCAPKSGSHSLLIPVGRSAVVGGNAFRVLVDAEACDPQVTYDNHGGYWVEIPYDPRKNSEVLLQITVRDTQPALHCEQGEDLQRWLSPSELVDSDHPALVARAEDLAEGNDSAVDRALRIQRFVVDHLEFRIYTDHFDDRTSETYEMGFGTCVNHARLFVALCRAANVPARTVWGIIYKNGLYDHHHEWAEFLDDGGCWRPLDSTFTTSPDLSSDIRYLDLVYASEENPLYEQSRSERYGADVGQIIVYDTTDRAHDDRIGFRLVDKDAPSSRTVENQFVLADIPGLMPQRGP